MHKMFVLDTSVLLHEPRSVYAFGDNDVVIPAVVIEEIDGKKSYQDIVGRNAREVARELDKLRELGSLCEGVELPNGGRLRVEVNHKSLNGFQEYFHETNNDNRILAVALNLHREEKEKESKKQVILVSKDAIMRIKADSLNILSQDYLYDKIEHAEEEYQGILNVTVDSEVIDKVYQLGVVRDDELKEVKEYYDVYPNQFVVLKDSYGSSKSAILRYDAVMKKFHPLHRGEESYWGIKGKNAEQRMALELLLDDNIKLVTLTGKAGTGKTLLSLAAGLVKVQDERIYQKLLITKPVVPVGRDIGFLPGDKDEKLRPWVQPIYDNLEFLLDAKHISDIKNTLIGLKNIEIEAMTYIRGRSIPNQFIIIDEAQNLTKHEVKTIVTRVGEGSKIVMMGDTEQIDHPYLDSQCNGLTYIINKFKDINIAGHITLKKVERSVVAQLAAELL
ncbi:PhoH family protein [Thermotalea metallivorans]|uniref:PhoH-like protein n=1 Tax=Thermotalea metallivorans TaxID=520762 RepID=A0A140LAU5_9FIRM|nr:PhoH family protein [Thermotalea metallivorans]KXG77670.1 PhoH-like protein [Thermotalea metallivorans]